MSVAHPILDLDARGLRKFGFSTGAIIAALFGILLPWLLELRWPTWPWIVLAALTVPALLAPAALRPVYRGWMTFGMLANRITAPLILGAVFFLLISPLGLLRGLLGKNDMRHAFRKSTVSYRVPSQRKPPSSLEKPF